MDTINQDLVHFADLQIRTSFRGTLQAAVAVPTSRFIFEYNQASAFVANSVF